VNEKTLEKRQAILESLVRHIFRYGFASLTMEEAASCARVSKRTLYKHYANKDALLEAVLDFQVTRFSTVFAAIAQDQTMDGISKIKTVLITIVELAKRLPAVLMRDMMSDDQHYWEKVQKIRRERIMSIIEGIILDSRDLGLIREDIATPLLTTLLFTTMDAIANPMVLSRIPFETKDVIEGLLNMLFQGILSDSGRVRMADAKPVSSIAALEAIL
jgi:AcrR family transcriptional regulator